MTFNPVRGLKFGAANAALFPIITSINSYFHGEEINVRSLAVGTAVAFVVFALIWAFTDKIGTQVGD